MPVEYALNESITDAVISVVNDETYEEFIAIRQQELHFHIAAMTKVDKEGEAQATSGEPVVVRRIGPADAVFLEGHFKIYVCQTRWDEASEIQRKAMIHRALMKISIEEKKGVIKIGVRKPDVVTFQQTIVRFGAWEQNLILLRNNLQAAQRRMKQVEEPVETR